MLEILTFITALCGAPNQCAVESMFGDRYRIYVYHGDPHPRYTQQLVHFAYERVFRFVVVHIPPGEEAR